jgi:primosomal protein N' (replication factor Y)
VAEYIRVALPLPLSRLYDYRVPSGTAVCIGARVWVPFGQRQLLGLVVDNAATPDYDVSKIKAIHRVVDDAPVWNPRLWQLLNWAATYYHHPLGEVLGHALPAALRKGDAADYHTVQQFSVSAQGAEHALDDLKRAPQQRRLLAALQQGPRTAAQLRDDDFSASALKALRDKGLVQSDEITPVSKPWQYRRGDEPLRLNPEQAVAVAAMTQYLTGPRSQGKVWLLEGVTGSGKTEVYLQAMEPVLEAGQQVMVLVPEIGLTPQTVARFKARFDVPVVTLHSGLTDSERMHAWLQVRDGQAAIIIGTRSAIFTPCKALGLIVLDEEHDNSFKQQDGFRYNARDLAVKRAHDEKLALVLGTATPSLESLANVSAGRYQHLQLTERAGLAQKARHQIIDLKAQRMRNGLSEELLARMQAHLQAGNQVLLFLNRRGFASALLCHECGWVGECSRCQTPFTVHQQKQQLHCHHCGAQRTIPHQCHGCGSTQLITQGVGTEQLETVLREQLPDYPVLRIDRDSTRKKGQLAEHLEAAASGDFPILIGTQMLAKGHHFPNVTLVALLDVDGALYSSDFRAPERLGQLYTQVAGRAGRASKPGTVVLQTHHPEHPLLQELVQNGYHDFARSALQEREIGLLPPYAAMALIRAEAQQESDAVALLQAMADLLHGVTEVAVIGPMPAPLVRRAGRYRYQLLLHSQQRKYLHTWLQQCRPALEALPQGRKARWSLDIDPQDFT